MKIEDSFLGIGWSFPPEFNKETKSIQMVSAIEDINQSLHVNPLQGYVAVLKCLS